MTRLRRHVDMLAGVIGPRHLERPGSMEASLAYIEREFQSTSDHPAKQTYPVDARFSASNLVVERPGTKQQKQIVVVGAHYDTVPGTSGADDNASGVAVLIEAARLLHGRAHRRTLRFIAFACEEPPHFQTQTMGSQVHARACREAGERVVGMLALEMVGFYTTNRQIVPEAIPGWLRAAVPKKGDFLAAVGNLRSAWLCWGFRRGFKRATDFPLFAMALPESVSEIRLSDNSSFWDYGYPALMLTDTSFLRNPHYHRASDTPNTLDYHSMAEVTVGVAGALSFLARPA